MRLLTLLPFAALSAAIVIPDEQVMRDLAFEPRKTTNSWLDKLPTKSELIEEFEDAYDSIQETSRNAIDTAFELARDTRESLSEEAHHAAHHAKSWIEQEVQELPEFNMFDDDEDHDHPPHHGPPHHGPPHRGPPGHHHKPNMTLYQLISESKYTTKLAKLIEDDEELVKVLNGTAANYTVFAPTDRAFEKIPKHGDKPSKEDIRELIMYHVSPDFYPAGRILVSRTLPTLHKEASLGKEPRPQRLSTNIGLRGLTVNFYSRIVAVNIFGTNGVIHGVDSILVPPPKTLKIIDLLPGEFSTLELALGKTGLLETLNSTKHAGGTLFAPDNFAFQKLGPRITAFLFSPPGLKYLAAILKYHVVANQTLYSDAYYKADGIESMDDHDHHRPGWKVPKGFFEVELPTLLEDKKLQINVARYGRLIEIKINGFVRVTVSDGIAKDGVIHVISDVLIPPKKLGGAAEMAQDLTVEELAERLAPFVDESMEGPKLDL